MHYQCPECDKEGKTISEVKKNGCKCNIEPWNMLDSKDHEESKKPKSDKVEVPVIPRKIQLLKYMGILNKKNCYISKR